MRRYALLAVALVAVALVATLALLALTPPRRHYDAETGVMCYTVPVSIACVRLP